MHYLVAFHFCNHLAEEEYKCNWLLYLKSLLASAVSCLWRTVSLPQGGGGGVVGWAAVCNVAFPSYTYLFLKYITHDCFFFSFFFHLPYYRNHFSFTLLLIYF